MNIRHMFKRKTSFDEALANFRSACTNIIQESSSRLAKDNQRFAAKAATNNYVYSEWGFQKNLENHLERLSIKIQSEVERRIIDILPPLSDNQKNAIKEFLDSLFNTTPTVYWRGWNARQSSRGNPNVKPDGGLTKRIDSMARKYKTKVANALQFSYNTRSISYREENKTYNLSFIIAFILGFLSSFLATWIWDMLFTNN